MKIYIILVLLKYRIPGISNALLSVHEKASTAVASGDDVIQAKPVTDLCRTMVAQTALALEQRIPKLWEIFVQDPMHKLSSNMNSSSSGRVCIAYVACLVSSGGIKTLKLSLNAGLGKLLGTLNDAATEDEQDVATAVYGIGAFFASCRAALDQNETNGIYVHPLPLIQYSVDALEQTLKLINEKTYNNNGKKEIAKPVQVAAIRALESILLASPSDVFTDIHTQQITSTLRSLALQILATSNNNNDSMDIDDDDEFSVQRERNGKWVPVLLMHLITKQM